MTQAESLSPLLEPPARTAYPSLPGIARVSSETLSVRVYRGLRDYLMAGQAQPGQKLTLRDLAYALGTSPMPVREAVGRLAAEGALEALPNRTIRVPVMTRSRFIELRRIRLALEGLAVEEAAARVTSEDLKRLAELNAAFTQEMRRRNTDEARLFRANKDFHFLVYERAEMPVLLAAIEGLWVQIGPVLHRSLRIRAIAQRRGNPAPHWHERLIRALKQHDAKAARSAIEGDLMSAGDLILEYGDLPG